MTFYGFQRRDVLPGSKGETCAVQSECQGLGRCWNLINWTRTLADLVNILTPHPVGATWHKALKQLDLVAWMELCAKRVAKACRIYNDVPLPWKSKTMGV